MNDAVHQAARSEDSADSVESEARGGDVVGDGATLDHHTCLERVDVDTSPAGRDETERIRSVAHDQVSAQGHVRPEHENTSAIGTVLSGVAGHDAVLDQRPCVEGKAHLPRGPDCR